MSDDGRTTHILHIDSSPAAASVSRAVGRELITTWSRRDPAAVLTYRDLAAEPIAFVDEEWIAAAFTPAELRDEDAGLALLRSDELIAELEAADVLVIGAPMYNFGIPASLKAWIDQVVRLGRTFDYQDGIPVGTVHGKRAIIVATAGGDADYYASLGLDHRTSYLKAILGFIGITDVEVVNVIDTRLGADLDAARARIEELLSAAPAMQAVPA